MEQNKKSSSVKMALVYATLILLPCCACSSFIF